MTNVFDCVKFVFILLFLCVVLTLSAQESSSEFTNSEWNRFQGAAESLLRRSKRQVASDDAAPKFPPGDFPQPAICGINGKSTNLIKEGDPSPGIDWPWIAGIISKDMDPPESFCGGSLLNRNYVLTAAHCFERYTAEQIFVRMGEYNFDANSETKYVDYQVEKIINHPQYDSPLHKNDVTLLKLSGLVQYSQYIRPICLPSADYEIKVNQTALVAGWGQTAFGEINSRVLLQVSIPVWHLEHCQENYGSRVFDQNICASAYEGNRDSCVGDSGGPLISQIPGERWVQLGIVSWGVYCGDAEKAGVYASVKYFLDWIRKNMVDAVF